jgi:hypothetical protein
MTSVTTTVDTGQREQQQSRQGRRSVVGMTAATLVLLGGVALWQGRPDASSTTTRTSREAAPVTSGSGSGSRSAVAGRPAEPAVGVSDQEQSSGWQASVRGNAATAPRTPADVTVYLVATDEAAMELRALFESAPLAVRYEVLVLDATEAGNQVLYRMLDGYHHQNGLPAMAVVDLRARAVQPQQDLSTACGGLIGDCRD